LPSVRIEPARRCGSAIRKGIESLYLDDLMRTADAAEGIAAFMAKRRPQWQNR
jgi:hypothetical protein